MIMSGVTRRQAMQTAVGLTTAAVPVAAKSDDDNPPPRTDREVVLAVGMTEAEADCWALAAQVAGKFFELPELHPMDQQEVASAIHVIQNKLLSRPTYRGYLELAKAAAAARQPKPNDAPPHPEAPNL